ncbi:MAG: hypothetical protein ACLP4R_27055 [Solirubrobacteraceae bacterium]
MTFAVGALLSLPGASYLAALDGIVELKAGTTITILLVLVVTVIILTLLEMPMISFAVVPDWTPARSTGPSPDSLATGTGSL